VQRFRYIVSLASLAYTFTVLHAIQYSMDDHHDDGSTTQNPQDHDSTNHSTLSSTNDTLATTSVVETAEKSSKQWTEHEIDLLLQYVEQNCVLTTPRGLNLKKTDFNRASNMIKTKDAGQCKYKWGSVSIFIIDKRPDYLSIIIAMFCIQGDFALGQEVRLRLA
jgi:hypothetical protein